MHKRAGELNQAFVKIAVGTGAIQQPQIFEDIVCFVKFLPIKQHEKAGVARINSFADKSRGERGDAFMFFAHGNSLVCGAKIQIPKVNDRERSQRDGELKKRTNLQDLSAFRGHFDDAFAVAQAEWIAQQRSDFARRHFAGSPR